MAFYVIDAVRREAVRAERKYGSPRSAHESYGVLAEEMAELLEAIKANNAKRVRDEAVQVSAVAARLADACYRRDAAFYKRSGFNGRR